MNKHVWVANEDMTLRAMHCKISMLLSKEEDGPVTHASIYWYDDSFDEKTGAHHIIPIELVFYEAEETEDDERPVAIRHEIVVSRMTITETMRNAVFERDGHSCVQCGSTDNLQVDHIYPFSKGGKTEMDNLQTLCKSCNVKKGAKI
jgi:hypothetical protein